MSVGQSARDRLTGVLLGAAALAMGLMAGLFFAFDVSVMPGLAKTDDRTYATAMQNFNSVIDGSGPFVLVFVGALAVTAWAAFRAFRKGQRAMGQWLLAAALCYTAVLALTMGINIPLNNKLADLGHPGPATDYSVIEDFKGTWETANIFRTLLCLTALGGIVRALLLHGRATATSTAS
ncbi:anthrone oxygenase family protein [Streptomyces melanogenes]|uniref:anthrone oxygenase family protein n=1 Tax=Streptomyces melanogenes TaxID=67326 RepID=UPI001E3CE2E4|nr:DUF1772 domain-containing protein [Streptomyces melanogenes]